MLARNNLGLLRSLIHELRLSVIKQGQVRESALYEYVSTQYRQNAVTDSQYCREQDEQAFLAETYVTYLRSKRLLKAVYEEYYGKKERSIEDTAKMVGFKLPQDRS